MQRGFLEERWTHTSALMAIIHNSQCDKKSKMKKPDDFNPVIRKKARLTKEQTTGALKGFLKSATGGKFKESDCKYQLINGAYVMVNENVTKEAEV